MLKHLNFLNTKFSRQNSLNKLIFFNVLIFIFTHIFFGSKFKNIYEHLLLPVENQNLITQPWSLLTYMFFHADFNHLLINLIWLYFSGKIFLRYLSQKLFLQSFILGGITGGLIFVLVFNYIPLFQPLINSCPPAIGSSAAVTTILVSIATLVPNLRISVPIIGNIKLKYFAIVFISLQITTIYSAFLDQKITEELLAKKFGTSILHLSGAFFGFIFIKKIKKEGSGINKLLKLYKKIKRLIIHENKSQKKNFTDYEFNEKKVMRQKKIDKILDKISKSGYESLNKEEKALLFSESKK